MVKTAANPGGLPLEVFDGFRETFLANRSQFFHDIPAGRFTVSTGRVPLSARASSTIGGARA